jgi:hypothetical protein
MAFKNNATMLKQGGKTLSVLEFFAVGASLTALFLYAVKGDGYYR